MDVMLLDPCLIPIHRRKESVAKCSYDENLLLITLPPPTIFAEETLADVALKTAKFSSSIVSHYSGEICIGVPIVVCRCILVAKY